MSDNISIEITENDINIIKKVCTFCKLEYPIGDFVGTRKSNPVTKTCKNCRDKNKIRDSKRDKEHRNAIARKNDSKPERKAVKKKWNDNNYEKVAKKWLDYRQRKIENNGIEEYRKIQADYAKNWRNNNKDKTILANENKKKNMNSQYLIYSRTANYKNLDFFINFDDYVSIVKKPCYYCNIIQDKGSNGIDRIDSAIGYTIANSVSCCQICNYMKGSLSFISFIKRIEHILTFQKIIDGNLYKEYFSDNKKSSYKNYKNRAIKKNLEFLLTENDYEDITNKNCYFCGKENTIRHSNGIDRIDNSKGYIINNVSSCCSECNYMKRNYSFQDVINKFILIHANHKEKNYEEHESNIGNNKHIIKGNKKSKELKKFESKIKTDLKTKELIERYQNEEYKINKCIELANKRIKDS
jgi:hypothetical protein